MSVGFVARVIGLERLWLAFGNPERREPWENGVRSSGSCVVMYKKKVVPGSLPSSPFVAWEPFKLFQRLGDEQACDQVRTIAPSELE